MLTDQTCNPGKVDGLKILVKYDWLTDLTSRQGQLNSNSAKFIQRISIRPSALAEFSLFRTIPMSLIDTIFLTDWISVITTIIHGIAIPSVIYITSLIQCIQNPKYSDMKAYENDAWARVQVFSLSLIFKLWFRPHYRSASFQQDMKDNLRNVAVPGEITGL